VYSHRFYGNFTREDLSVPATGGNSPTGSGTEGGRPGEPRRVTNIRPVVGPDAEELRAQWMAPIIASVHEPGVIYAGYQYVFRSADRGDTWERISPDLTANDAAEMLLKSSSAVPYQTIVALAESPIRAGLLYAGTDDGRLHVTRDGGKTWTDLSANVPSRKWYSRIVPSAHDEGTVYITQRGREDDDFGVYIYKSTDYGSTFAAIASNMPAGSVNVIREDPFDRKTLFAGTDIGVFISLDSGGEWHVLGARLPSGQISDLAYHARDALIVISTYGRGMFALDAARLRPAD
jgi:photosystem II stability/assembly factor-like uncharacterized protein